MRRLKMKKMKKAMIVPLALGVSGLILMGCNENNPFLPNNEPRDSDNSGSTVNCSGKQLSPQTIKKGKRSSQDQDRNLVITSQKQWQSVWKASDINQPLPQIDFNKAFVIAAFQGKQMNGGHGIQIQDVCADKRSLSVSVQNRVPEQGCAVTQAIINPYHFVRIDRSSLPSSLGNLSVNFDEETKKTCDGKGGDDDKTNCASTSYHELYSSKMSAMDQADEKVIRSETAYNRLWQQLTTNTANRPKPKVDFSQKMVLAVFQGKQMTGGYTIAVTEVCRNNTNLNVTVEHREPGEGCGVYQAITQPCQFVTVPKVQGKVNFDVENVTRQCGN